MLSQPLASGLCKLAPTQDFAQQILSSTILKDDQGRPLNPLDAHFRSLGLSSMEPVKPKSKEFSALEAYARDTHGATHNYYQAKVLNVFRVERQTETEAWTKAGYDKLGDGDRLLLWHGSRTTNFAGMQQHQFYVRRQQVMYDAVVCRHS
jgi:poly [ADP-ribose] polymerase 2/3/4